ncbi:MAG: hypothetical protein Q9167_007759 [Letrouitia subvulpina]
MVERIQQQGEQGYLGHWYARRDAATKSVTCVSGSLNRSVHTWVFVQPLPDAGIAVGSNSNGVLDLALWPLATTSSLLVVEVVRVLEGGSGGAGASLALEFGGSRGGPAKILMGASKDYQSPIALLKVGPNFDSVPEVWGSNCKMVNVFSVPGESTQRSQSYIMGGNADGYQSSSSVSENA